MTIQIEKILRISFFKIFLNIIDKINFIYSIEFYSFSHKKRLFILQQKIYFYSKFIMKIHFNDDCSYGNFFVLLMVLLQKPSLQKFVDHLFLCHS